MRKILARKRSLGKFLRKSYGLGKSKGVFFSKFLGLNSRFCSKKLRGVHVNCIKKKVRSFFFGSELKERVREAVLFLIRIKTYKGMRHKQKYPARGQRTHTNGKTKKKFRY